MGQFRRNESSSLGIEERVGTWQHRLLLPLWAAALDTARQWDSLERQCFSCRGYTDYCKSRLVAVAVSFPTIFSRFTRDLFHWFYKKPTKLSCLALAPFARASWMLDSRICVFILIYLHTLFWYGGPGILDKEDNLKFGQGCKSTEATSLRRVLISERRLKRKDAAVDT